MKHIIIRTDRVHYEAWGSITEICRECNLPYHSLARRKFPFHYQGWDYIKVKFRTKFGS